jgi:hypothetical protein
MGMERPGPQRGVRFGRIGVMWPLLALLIGSVVLVVLAVAHGNEPGDRWPWTALGVSAAVFGLAVNVLVTRDHFARAQRPGIRYVTQWFDVAAALHGIKGPVWEVVITNAGPGVAEITGARWELRFAPPDAAPSPELVAHGSFDDMRQELTRRGFRPGVDYWVANVSPGAFIAVGEQVSIFEGSQTFVAGMAEFVVVYEYQSPIGYRYERGVRLLPPSTVPSPDEVHRRDLSR